MRRTVIHVSEILAAADAYYERFGRYPRFNDGPVAGALDSTWGAVNQALKKGHRGLRPGGSLAMLLREHRGKRHRGHLPDFNLAQVLDWMDCHHGRSGSWPTCESGPISEAPGETWMAVDKALRNRRRGFTERSSLAQVLVEHRGVRPYTGLRSIAVAEVLAWVDAYHARAGRWPLRGSGSIPEAPGETWLGLNEAFCNGTRGLAGYGSLARCLDRHRGVRNNKAVPPLHIADILAWAAGHLRRCGRLPRHISGPIPEAPGETWAGVNAALYRGGRGMPGGSSLFRLLREHFAEAWDDDGSRGSKNQL
jgi:hypothetical protein